MPASSFTTCEVKIGGAWAVVGAAEAHARHRSDPKRCPVCHGQAVSTSTYGSQPKVYLGHFRAHDGCPNDARRFCGTARPHPQALA